MFRYLTLILCLLFPFNVSAFTANWNSSYEAVPADGDNLSQGAGKIRDFKTDTRERIDIDHYMDEAGTQADHGQHRQVNFQAPIGTPSNAANKSFLYSNIYE